MGRADGPSEIRRDMSGSSGLRRLIRGELAGLSPVALAFAWTRKTSHEIRTLLGNTNFFQQFKVTFEACDNSFEIASRK